MTPERFDEFYGASVARLTGQLYTLTGSLAEAQDVVQDAFVKAWLHRAELDRARSPEAWVRTVAWRLAISRFRRTKTGARAWSRADVRHVDPPGEPTDPALLAALRALPEDQRYAVVMFHLVDRSVQEIADEVACPVGTIKARLSRGRAALAASLKNTALAEEHHG
ncbi:MAG: RNA polymerase sigma factor [Nocardioidaceae bacterium]